MGTDCPLAALCRERHSHVVQLYRGCLSAIPEAPCLAHASWPARTDGADVLHYAVGDRRHLVLRLGIWTWHNLRPHHHRTDGRHRLPLPDSRLQVVASLFPLRPARVDLAHAYLRPLLPHILEGVKVMKKRLSSMYESVCSQKEYGKGDTTHCYNIRCFMG